MNSSSDVYHTYCDNYADGDVDYDSDSQTVLFDSCQRSHCVDIAIVDDTEIEDSETFTVSLARQNGSPITVEPSVGQIEILDNDSMYTRDCVCMYIHCT